MATRSRRRNALALLVLLAFGALIIVAASHQARNAHSTHATHTTALPGAAPSAPLRAEVTLASGAHPRRIPSSYLGLSTEYWAVPAWERQSAVIDRVLSLLHVPGDSPMVLRIGGDSANQALWESEADGLPEWVVELTPSWLSQAGALVRRAHVRLILDLNLVTASPAISAEWAGAAEAGLPHGGLAGFEIGNEPDLYSRQAWIHVVSRTIAASQLLPDSLTPSEYAEDFRAYARAVGRLAPGVPLLGPAVGTASRGTRWIAALLASSHPGLREVTVHQYPYSACALPGSPRYPTIAGLLGAAATAGMARALEPAVRTAARAGFPVRLTELNSVDCGGRAGVSDTFATALWAPDALFALLGAGVDAVDVHVNPGKVNAAFALSGHGLSANPLLYGLILFARTIGPDSKLVPVRVVQSRSLRLKAWAVRMRSGAMRVLLINRGEKTATVEVRIAGLGTAQVERLRAPSIGSRSGVTLAGQHLSASGRWLGTESRERIIRSARGYQVMMPRFSAALFEASPS
jgi:hypothetical protein